MYNINVCVKQVEYRHVHNFPAIRSIDPSRCASTLYSLKFPQARALKKKKSITNMSPERMRAPAENNKTTNRNECIYEHTTFVFV